MNLKTPLVRFRENPVGPSLVRLVDIIFAVTLTQTLVIYRQNIAALDNRVLLATIGLVYLTVGLSWYGYHKSILRYPYNESRWSLVRVFFDVIILVIYAFLTFVASDLNKVVCGLGVVFALYAVDGRIRRAEWNDNKVSKPWLSAGYSIVFFVLFWLTRRHYLGSTTVLLISFLLVGSFRSVRGWLGYPKVLAVGVDVDGVLGEQIPALLARVQSNKKIGLALTKESITDWAFQFDGTDVAKEMEDALLDKTFVTGMGLIEGSQAAMRELYSLTHLVVATSRPIESDGYTEEWLDKHFLFHEVANTRETGKAFLPLDILIDDNVDNIKEFVSSPRHGAAILFSQPWNHGAESDPELSSATKEKRLIRCSKWIEIVASIKTFQITGKFKLK